MLTALCFVCAPAATGLGYVAARNGDYVDEAYSKLKDQCQSGVITGIQTRYSTSHNFLSWKNEVLMRGYCVD